MLLSCNASENKEQNKNTIEPDGSNDYTVHAYNQNSSLSKKIESCYKNHRFGSDECYDIQAIGPDATIDKVLERLLVTHDWAGDNFKLYFENLKPEAKKVFLKLIEPLKVLRFPDKTSTMNPHTNGSECRIDFQSGWLSRTKKQYESIDWPQEAQILKKTGKFKTLYGTFLINAKGNRIPSDKIISTNAGKKYLGQDFNHKGDMFFYIMYHELAHLADTCQYPHKEFNQYPVMDKTLSQYFYPHPFPDEEPISAELSHNTAVNRYKADVAVRPYAYANEREDFAVTFEAVAANHLLDLDYYTFFFNETDSDLPVHKKRIIWGEKNKILADNMRPKLESVLDKLDLSDLINIDDLLAKYSYNEYQNESKSLIELFPQSTGREGMFLH